MLLKALRLQSDWEVLIIRTFCQTCVSPKVTKNTVDGRNPANHLGCIKPRNNGIFTISTG